jgi:hypothetical protein
MDIIAPGGARRKVIPSATVIAIDTEFQGAHTLTVQAAARIDPDTVAVQVYRAAAVPELPVGFDVNSYLPTTLDMYQPFCGRIEVRPVKSLTPGLSPARMFADLYGVPGLDFMSRPAAWHLFDLAAPLAGGAAAPFGPNARPKRRFPHWDVPLVSLTLVGHFLRADFGRVFGRKLWQDIGAPHPRDPGRVWVRARRLIELVEARGRRTTRGPVLEYAWHGADLHAVRVDCRDTMLPYGPASLDGHCQTFLRLGKSACLTPEEKGRMLRTFRERAHDAYGYAIADAVNTLLVYEQMARKDADIYRAFGFGEADDIPPLRPTLGSRVSTFLIRTAQRELGQSRDLPSRRALESLRRKGSLALFGDHPDASRFGDQTCKTHGGLLYSRSPTRFWHEAPGLLRDVDMSGCYGGIVSRLSVYLGRPVIFEPGSTTMTLNEAVDFVKRHAEWDAWMVRASGPIAAAPNALVPSTENAVTSLNYRPMMAKGRRRRAGRRAFHLEALRDPGSVKGTGGSRLYASVVESGIITSATWLLIQALPETQRQEYEGLRADSIAFYPAKLVAGDGGEYDGLVERYARDALPWEEELDLDNLELVRRLRIDAEYVSVRYPIGRYASRVAEFRADARRAEGKGSGLDLAWKVHGNSMYGVLACPLLPASNFLAANQVTAWARAEAFALGQALNAIQTITDGCTYRLDQVPACSYEECLRIKPDYPIRRAEGGDGIPFLDPTTIPQDDAGFTAWYRDHVMRFFGVSGKEHDALFSTHSLEHKKTSLTGSVAFDALACDGAGNYLKCVSGGPGGWQVAEFKARSYREDSKKVLEPWLVEAYSHDRLTELAPLAEDVELLSFDRAGQRARKALDTGMPQVLFPLGLEVRRVQNYRVLKPSAFIFETPEQRAALLKQWQRFEERTACGLEVLALRRAYRGRRQGSLTDLAEEIYRLVRGGGTNLTAALNLRKRGRALDELAAARAADIARRKAAAEADLFAAIDVRGLDPATLPTAWLVTADDVREVRTEEEGG